MGVLTVLTACTTSGPDPTGAPEAPVSGPAATGITPAAGGDPSDSGSRASSAPGLSGAVAAEVAKVAAARLGQIPDKDDVTGQTRSDGRPPTSTSSVARLTRRGDQLLLDGKPYRYVGLNAYGLNGQETGRPYSRSQVDSLFRSLPTGTLTRTWAWKSDGARSLKTVVRSAEAYNQMLILSLSEGAGFDSGRRRSEAWFRSGFKKDLLPWVEDVVTRYRNSRAIGMWEIMNEPGNLGGTSGGVKPATMKYFLDTVAATIKRLDPNHLVETGTMDGEQRGTGNWVALNSGPNIDVMSVHEYADTYEGGIQVSRHFSRVAPQIRKVGKPVILGEVGVRGADSGCVRTRSQRAAVLRRKFDAYFARGVDGINVWNWFPDKKQRCANGESIHNGDPVMTLLRKYRPR